MRKNYNQILLAILLSLSTASYGQQKIVISNTGPFMVGLRDTVIFKSNELLVTDYYTGAKPFFIKIWYPSKDKGKQKLLRFKDLFEVDIPSTSPIADSMNSLVKNQIIRYALSERLYNNNVPIGTNEIKMYEELMNLETSAAYKRIITKGKHPCIFYHHGSNSFNFDNYAFCEFMASHGFVVVASNFEWPLGGNRYAVSTSNDKVRWPHENIDFVIRFILAEKYIDKDQMYAIGHSWGAQELVTLNSSFGKPFKLIFSLHTTAENKDENGLIKEYRELYSALKDSENNLTTKTIAFSPALPNLNFKIFQNNKNAIYDFIVIDQPMSHDGFITLGSFRVPFLSHFDQVEQRALRYQFESYNEVCNYIKNEILSSHSSSHKRLWRFSIP